MWGAGSVVANRFSAECDKTYLGIGMKKIVMITAAPVVALCSPAEESPEAPKAIEAKKDPVVAQPVSLQIADAVAPLPQVQEISENEAAKLEAKAKRNVNGKRVQAERVSKAKAQAKSTWLESMAKAGLVTASVVVTGVLFHQIKADMKDFSNV